MALTREQRVHRRDLIRSLYALERRYGVSAEWYKITEVAPSIELGRSKPTIIKYHIPRFVTHGVTIDHKFEYDLGYLRANSNFTYGGLFEPNDRIAVLRNTFGSVEVDLKDYIIYVGRIYSIKQVVSLDFQLGWLLQLRHTPGTKFYQLHDRTIWSRVTPTQDVEETL